MKVRIGVGAGAHPFDAARGLAGLVDDLDQLGFDSLWLSEVLSAPAIDPLTGLAFAAALNPHLKLGVTMVLPGRNAVRLAKELATLDRLSSGRLLVTFVPGLTQSPEAEAINAPAAGRGALIDDALPLLRRLWSGATVSHDGPAACFDSLRLSPLPVQDPLEAWLGGMAPAALRRCGRLGDGWLPSLCTPAEAAAGRTVIDEVAAAEGRAISGEHFGVSVGYSHHPLPAGARAAIAARRRGLDPAEVVPVGFGALRDLLEEYLAAGFSKFVVRPLEPPASWRPELEQLAASVGDLQT
ncbi:MAG: hypothetical protein QOG64_277 [Acidimicrobiaceae bacterium]|nr:hypothetical protein [Acidimicrobiaceae bacterium]